MIMNKCQSWLFLVEGDMEKALLKELKEHHNLIVKDIKKFNLWNSNLNSLLPIIKQNIGVVIIFDTDTLDRIEFFKKNLSLLSRKVKYLFIIQQNKNFEDELCFSCCCSQSVLFRAFAKKNTSNSSVSEFKRNFMLCKQRIKKLEGIHFSHEKLWSKQSGLISLLMQYDKYHTDFSHLVSSLAKLKK